MVTGSHRQYTNPWSSCILRCWHCPARHSLSVEQRSDFSCILEIVTALNEKVLSAIRGKLIVSCQASKGDPLDDPDVLCRMATSVLRGGPGGLRAEGSQCVTAFRRLTSLPIIGLVKTTDNNGEVYITPTFAAAKSVSDAGAEVIALDCTRRRLTEPEPWPGIISKIHSELGKVVCAEIGRAHV